MAILADHAIKRAMIDGRFNVDPFTGANVEPAAIDLTLGPEAFRASDEERRLLDEGGVLELPAGVPTLVLTRERIELGEDLAGSLGLRSSVSGRGVALLTDARVSPGFDGHLHVLLINLSSSDVTLEYGEPFLRMELHDLSGPAEATAGGTYRSEPHLTTEEIRDVREDDAVTLSEAQEAMRTIARDVSAMEETVDRLTTEVLLMLRVVVGLLTALVVGGLAALYWEYVVDALLLAMLR